MTAQARPLLSRLTLTRGLFYYLENKRGGV
nr:MAG TPA: hypothetical protein [Bacteriophage sp.]